MILDKFSPQIVMHSDGLKKEDTIQNVDGIEILI